MADELRGVEGWLALAFIQTIAAAIAAIYFSFAGKGNLPTAVYILFGIFYVVTIILGLMEKKVAKIMFIISYITGMLLGIWNVMQGSDMTSAASTIISSGLWIWYFMASQRVKNTFVN